MSKADAVCAALLALWQADTDLSGVQIVDGPQANSDAANEWLFVGHDGDAPDEGNEAVAVEQDLMAFLKTQQESGEVTCAVVIRDGSADPAGLRGRAYSILSTCSDDLRQDMQLGNLVMHAYVSGHQYIPVITQSGAKARVVFTVTYLAQL